MMLVSLQPCLHMELPISWPSTQAILQVYQVLQSFIHKICLRLSLMSYSIGDRGTTLLERTAERSWLCCKGYLQPLSRNVGCRSCTKSEKAVCVEYQYSWMYELTRYLILFSITLSLSKSLFFWKVKTWIRGKLVCFWDTSPGGASISSLS